MLGIEPGLLVLLAVCLLAACTFEFVNGFHDTANAVATVIYTNSLEPRVAVVWSGLCNFAGVMTGGIAVAMGIVNLLPVESLTDQSVGHSVAMILALLFSAIIWNVGTWYLGLPSSSSHTLIGSIIGVGMAFSLLPGGAGSTGVNWAKAGDIGLSLLISPVFGFSLTVFLMYFLRRIIHKKGEIFKEPVKSKKPPGWIRGTLILTCTGVSFFHGQNDGQKGVGLMMLVLIGIVPAYFALNGNIDRLAMEKDLVQVERTVTGIDTLNLSVIERSRLHASKAEVNELRALLRRDIAHDRMADSAAFRKATAFSIRRNILLLSKDLTGLLNSENTRLSQADERSMQANISNLRAYTDYAPTWVTLLISISLGLGTMVGWKRIVVTIGEKIGKSHLTYAQGASAELVAASTIGVSSWLGLPVSTTHVLSSGIAGSMVAGGGIRNLQKNTIRNILLAWLLTFPVSLALSGSLFLFFRWLI